MPVIVRSGGGLFLCPGFRGHPFPLSPITKREQRPPPAVGLSFAGLSFLVLCVCKLLIAVVVVLPSSRLMCSVYHRICFARVGGLGHDT